MLPRFIGKTVFDFACVFTLEYKQGVTNLIQKLRCLWTRWMCKGFPLTISHELRFRELPEDLWHHCTMLTIFNQNYGSKLGYFSWKISIETGGMLVDALGKWIRDFGFKFLCFVQWNAFVYSSMHDLIRDAVSMWWNLTGVPISSVILYPSERKNAYRK